MKNLIGSVIASRQRLIVMILIEVAVAVLFLSIHNFIGQSTASTLLTLSETAFVYENASALPTILVTIVASIKIEVMVLFLILSLKTALVLCLENPSRKSSVFRHFINPRFISAFILSGFIVLIATVLGFFAFLISGFIILFLVHSWLIELVSLSQFGIRSVTLAIANTSRHWKLFFAPYVLLVSASLLLTLIIGYVYIEFSGGGIVPSVIALSVIFFLHDRLYLQWQLIYLKHREDKTTLQLPIWLTVMLGTGLVVLLITTFVIIRAIMGISNDVSLRQQMLYDLLPPAETKTLLFWQEQLELQNKRALSVQEQQNLDALINQMSQELNLQSTTNATDGASAHSSQ